MASPQKLPHSPPSPSSPSPSASASPTRKHNYGDGEVILHRAKAFLLNTETNDWDEMATGYCSPDPSEVSLSLVALYLFLMTLFIGFFSVCN